MKKIKTNMIHSRNFYWSALFMVTSVMLFTTSHGFVRGIGSDIHPFQIAFFTSLFSFLFYFPWLLRTRFTKLRTDHINIHWIRAFLNAAAVWGWYIALTLTPLADAVALSLLGPVTITLGAIIFLGETRHLSRWLAMFVAGAGALMIVRPGFQDLNLGYVFVIINLVFMAGSRLLTKLLTRTEASIALGAWIALLQIPITLTLALFVWTWPNSIQLLIMILIGLLVGGAHYTLTLAYNRAEIGSLEPFNFIRLALAAGIGYFFFSEIPDPLTWIGAVVIIGSTTYIAHSEYNHLLNQKNKV